MYLVYGAGAIGSVIGGLLAEAGHAVVLYGRDPHMAAVARAGLRIEGIWGAHLVPPLLATGRYGDLVGRDYDAILLTVRTYDTQAAVEELAPLAGAETLVVSLQNGLGNCERIAAAVGPDRTVGGRVIFGAALPEPGVAQVTVYAEEVMLGPFGAGVPPARIEELARRMSAAGVPTLPTRDVMPYLWGKVLYNGALNPLSALLGWTYGELAECPHTRAAMIDAIGEMYEVARAEGVRLLQETAEAYEAYFFERQVPPTAAHRSSMLQAIERGRRTEIDAINGYVVALADRLGVAVPTNRLLVRLIHARESAGTA